jgi:hypothetical protein
MRKAWDESQAFSLFSAELLLTRSVELHRLAKLEQVQVEHLGLW